MRPCRGDRGGRTMSAEATTLRIDWIACNGYGACVMAAPDIVDLDDWGYPIVDPEQPVPDDLLRQARRAVSDCPMLALSLQRTGEPAGRRG